MRELIKQERLKDQVRNAHKLILSVLLYRSQNLSVASMNQKKKHAPEEGKQRSTDTEDKKERVITIRPLNMEDFREAKKQVQITSFYFHIVSSKSLK